MMAISINCSIKLIGQNRRAEKLIRHRELFCHRKLEKDKRLIFRVVDKEQCRQVLERETIMLHFQVTYQIKNR